MIEVFFSHCDIGRLACLSHDCHMRLYLGSSNRKAMPCNNLLLIDRYLQTQINNALQSKILITTSLILLITDIKMSINTNIMIYSTRILVGYIELNYY